MGNDLFKKIIDLTELPSDEISQELRKVLEAQGIDPKHVSIGELREALASYVHEIFKEDGLVQVATDEEALGWDENVKFSFVH